MELIAKLTALCGEGLHGLSSLPAGLPLSLFLAGLAGSLVHCVGMCGPFVLTQVVADAGSSRQGSYGEWRRLGGASLAPYHLGRLTTYTALGAIADGRKAMILSSLSTISTTSGRSSDSRKILALCRRLEWQQANPDPRSFGQPRRIVRAVPGPLGI
jgi:hypothetical protein